MLSVPVVAALVRREGLGPHDSLRQLRRVASGVSGSDGRGGGVAVGAVAAGGSVVVVAAGGGVDGQEVVEGLDVPPLLEGVADAVDLLLAELHVGVEGCKNKKRSCLFRLARCDLESN